MSSDPPMTAAQWDARYRGEPELWTKEPNAPLAEFACELQPGRALDVGAGDGRNAIWLATQGWAVTAIDLSTVALQRAAERAAARDAQLECVVADWHEHDFGASAFELVVVSFMHPRPDAREALFERVAGAVVPGDTCSPSASRSPTTAAAARPTLSACTRSSACDTHCAAWNCCAARSTPMCSSTARGAGR